MCIRDSVGTIVANAKIQTNNKQTQNACEILNMKLIEKLYIYFLIKDKNYVKKVVIYRKGARRAIGTVLIY